MVQGHECGSENGKNQALPLASSKIYKIKVEGKDEIRMGRERVNPPPRSTTHNWGSSIE